MKRVLDVEEKLLLSSADAGEIERLDLTEVKITDRDRDWVKIHRFVLSMHVNKEDIGGSAPDCWEEGYERLSSAWKRYLEEINWRSDFEEIFRSDDFESDYADLCEEVPRTRSATEGNYSPNCPWNAPGMRVSDFI